MVASQHQYCTATSGFACIYQILVFSRLNTCSTFSCTPPKHFWPDFATCCKNMIWFLYNFVLASFLFHNGWVGKLKEDWRFPGTEPQGGDEKALSNNSNSHWGAFYHFHCSRFKIVTNFWYDVVKWFKFFQIIQSHCWFSNADI